MDYTKQVFDTLKMKPYDEFFIDKDMNFHIYRLTPQLDLEVSNIKKTGNISEWRESIENIADILNGKYTIHKAERKVTPTKEEQAAIDYARAAGYKWMCKDKNGRVFVYKSKPVKQDECWRPDGVSSYINTLIELMIGDEEPDESIKFSIIEIPVSFLSWEDDEPYYIGD